MVSRYTAEIGHRLPARFTFSYVDTKNGLADLLFRHLKIEIVPEMELSNDGDPFRVVICRVPGEQREDFFRAVDLLPALMSYAGYTDYEKYCREFFLNAQRDTGVSGTAGETGSQR